MQNEALALTLRNRKDKKQTIFMLPGAKESVYEKAALLMLILENSVRIALSRDHQGIKSQISTNLRTSPQRDELIVWSDWVAATMQLPINATFETRTSQEITQELIAFAQKYASSVTLITG